MSSSNDFIMKKSRKKKQPVSSSIDECVLDLYEKVEQCKIKLRNDDDSSYWSEFSFNFNQYLDQRLDNITSIQLVCFGLGSVDDSFVSRYQLAFMLLLMDDLKERPCRLDSVEVFDPVFSDIDKKLLVDMYKLRLSETNTQCKQHLDDDNGTLTLFYMPHCGKALYNNLLYANWSLDRLARLIIMGNDFGTIDTLTLDEDMIRYYSYIHDSIKLMQKFKVNRECSITNAFEDFCFQYFPLDKLMTGRLENVQLVNRLVINEDDDQIRPSTPVYEKNNEELA